MERESGKVEEGDNEKRGDVTFKDLGMVKKNEEFTLSFKYIDMLRMENEIFYYPLPKFPEGLPSLKSRVSVISIGRIF